MLNMHTIIAANAIVTTTVNAVVNVVAAKIVGMQKHASHLAGQYWLGQGQFEPVRVPCSRFQRPSFDRSDCWLDEESQVLNSLRMSRSISRRSR